MNARVAARLAIAETRRSRGTLSFCVFSIAIGVMSLTAVRAVTDSLRASITDQAREILGADLVLRGNQPLEGGVAAELTADLTGQGARSVELVEFFSMLTRAGDGTDSGALKTTTLVRVHGIGDGYPFYGSIATDPPEKLAALSGGPRVIVDPVVARELGLSPGDRVRLGELEGEVAAVVVIQPGTPTAVFSLAPSIYIHESFLAKTRLLVTGSRVRYQRLFALPARVAAEAWKDSHFEQAMGANLSIRTSRESAEGVQRFLSRMSRFLTVIGIITLLLGGLGIGSAMNAFMRGRLDHAAVLRCVGARPRDLFAIYSAVALMVGAVGSLLGVAVGSLLPVALGRAITALAAGALPAQFALAPSAGAAARGLAAGLVATFVFALVPIMRVASVAPLRVLRRHTEGLGESGVRSFFLLAGGAAAAFGFILLLSVVETESLRVGVWFTAAIAAALATMTGVARLAMAAARLLRHLPRYHLRQGIANLYRPGNQTGAVITAVGTGVLLLGSIVIVERSLQEVIAVEQREELPNLFIIDIQPDQRAGVEELAAEQHAAVIDMAPMVSARIGALNGHAIDKTHVERNAVERNFEDTLRTREYFLSYRDHPVAGEEVTAGEFWSGRPPRQEASIDERLAENVGVELGDTLTLDVQGIPVDAVVTSFRRIRWQAMRPNAMILLSPGEIEQAPHMFVSAMRAPEQRARYALQDRLVRRFPNLTVVDVTDTAATVRLLMERISAVFSVLGLLTLVTGAIILGGAIAAGRYARQRESVLLKVLGASRADLRRILVTEYAALAVLGAGCGWILAELVSRPALIYLFETPAVIPYAALVLLVSGAVALNVAVGVIIGRGVARRSPLEVMREE